MITIDVPQMMERWVVFLVALGNDHRTYCPCSPCVHARYARGWY